MSRAEQLDKLRAAWASLLTARCAIEAATDGTDIGVRAALVVISEAACTIEEATVALSGEWSMFSQDIADDTKAAAE